MTQTRRPWSDQEVGGKGVGGGRSQEQYIIIVWSCTGNEGEVPLQCPQSPRPSPMGRSPTSVPSSNLGVMNCINRRFVPPLVVPRRSLWAVIIAKWSLYTCPAVPGALFISRAAAEVRRNGVALCMTGSWDEGAWRTSGWERRR